MPSGDGATICGLSQGWTGSGMGGEGLGEVFQHPKLLGIYGCRLKSSYILLERMTWERGVGSQWAHAQWEVQVKKYFVSCHHGDLKHLFLGEVEEASCQKKTQIINTDPMNRASHRKREDCQKEQNGEVPWLHKRDKAE